MPATTKVYFSADRTWRLTVTPRAVSGALAYFEDKAAGREDAGALPGNLQKRAQGFMEHLEHGHWRVVWNEPLLNEVSPVEAIISPSGFVVTFDNWHGAGYGDDVVVIYDGHGKPVRAMGLKDFLPKEYIEALPHSVSSIWWGEGHHFSADGRQLVLRVVVPAESTVEAMDDAKAEHVELAFELMDGKGSVPDEPAWSGAMTKAARVDALLRARWAKEEAIFVAPLQSPHGSEYVDWVHYLTEAFFRVDADWQDGFPATVVLRLPTAGDYEASVDHLFNALRGELNRDGALMIASPSQDNLVRVLARLAKKVPREWLKDARVYVAVDAAHTDAAKSALARTGAKYIQLNPDVPIPQRKARLKAFQASKGNP
ncbi:hypothetical protein RHOFW104T7_14225 [Rhodanobacter thiooxydans]|uniref:Uncharacterized protein n=2 Tax=Rhodanobacter thiooxydans TaxID=416169 RepID=A0A154QGG8_9GAMM|nr:hypothetical protein [Rhodanobacter thiooxydans]EIL98879.1 hypothetical protein UUA_10711 [Rhodanobacter thiooxydans LCS2]KZC23331.1 hypothetical protein RHOFW104T7_14225 [Rhodanobacter thiooxydans]